jgi:hypothetical protein
MYIKSIHVCKLYTSLGVPAYNRVECVNEEVVVYVVNDNIEGINEEMCILQALHCHLFL